MSLQELGLRGKSAVVTAGASGIGAGVATALGALGVRVTIVDLPRQRDLAEAVVLKIVDAGGESVFAPADATDATAIDKMLEVTDTRVFWCFLFSPPRAPEWCWHAEGELRERERGEGGGETSIDRNPVGGG